MQSLLLQGMPKAQLSLLTEVGKYDKGWNSRYLSRELKLIIIRFLDEEISRLDINHKKASAQIEAGHFKLFLEWYLDAYLNARKLSSLKTFLHGAVADYERSLQALEKYS